MASAQPAGRNRSGKGGANNHDNESMFNVEMLAFN